MPEGRTQDRHVPQTADHAFEVSSDSAGKFPVHSLPHGDLISVMILRRADYYNDQMRGLALQYLHLMPRSDQTRIKFQLQEIEEVEEKLDKTNSRFRRFFLSIEYQHLSRKTYLLVKKVSNRVVNNYIKNQISMEATDAQVPPTVQPVAVKSHTVNTFADKHETSESPLVDAITSDVSRAEVPTYQSKTAGDPAVLLSLRGADRPTRHFVVTPSESNQEAETDTSSLVTVDTSMVLGPPSVIEKDI